MIRSILEICRMLNQKKLRVYPKDVSLAIKRGELVPRYELWRNLPTLFEDEEVNRWIRAIESIKEAEKKSRCVY